MKISKLILLTTVLSVKSFATEPRKDTSRLERIANKNALALSGLSQRWLLLLGKAQACGPNLEAQVKSIVKDNVIESLYNQFDYLKTRVIYFELTHIESYNKLIDHTKLLPNNTLELITRLKEEINSVNETQEVTHIQKNLIQDKLKQLIGDDVLNSPRGINSDAYVHLSNANNTERETLIVVGLNEGNFKIMRLDHDKSTFDLKKTLSNDAFKEIQDLLHKIDSLNAKLADQNSRQNMLNYWLETLTLSHEINSSSYADSIEIKLKNFEEKLSSCEMAPESFKKTKVGAEQHQQQ